MNKIKKIIVLMGVVGLVLGANMAFAETANNDMPKQSISISDSGKVSLGNAKVVSVEGSNINVTVSWGGTFSLPAVVKVEDSTDYIRKGGGKSTLSEIATGHYLKVEGKLDTSSATLTVIAKTIRNLSVVKTQINPLGTVLSIDTTAKTFMFSTESRGDLKVSVSDSTVFTKGGEAATFATLKVGDMATVKGMWEKNTNTLQADNVKIRINKKTSFQGGTIKTLPTSLTLPTTMIVTFGRIDYTVNIKADTAVLNSKSLKANLADFKLEDRVHVNGTADGTTIEATTVRNSSLR